MSFPNFGEGGQQPQQGGEQQGAFGAPGAGQEQNPMGQMGQQMGQQMDMGHQMDPNQQQGQFPGTPGGGPGGSGSQGGDQKTTLW